MALTYTKLTTLVNDCEDNTGFVPTVVNETDFFRLTSQSLGIDTDIETHLIKSPDFTAEDWTDEVLMVAMINFTAISLDTKALGGMGIGIEDSAGNQSVWFVAGSDTYLGGWKTFAASMTGVTPDFDNCTSVVAGPEPVFSTSASTISVVPVAETIMSALAPEFSPCQRVDDP